MSRTRFTDLPHEILEAILGQFSASHPFSERFPGLYKASVADLEGRQSLLALCLVSKDVASVATALLYRDVHSYNKQRLQESIAMENSGSRFKYTATFDAVPFEEQSEQPFVLLAIRQFPNLRHLTIILHSCYLPLAAELSHALSSKSCKLESLALRMLGSPYDRDRDPIRIRHFALPDNLVATLKHLGISVSRYGHDPCQISLPSKLLLDTFQLSCGSGKAPLFIKHLDLDRLLALDLMEFGHPETDASGRKTAPTAFPAALPNLQFLRLNLRTCEAPQIVRLLQCCPNLRQLEYHCCEMQGETEELFPSLPPSITHLRIKEADPRDLYYLYVASKAGSSYLPELRKLTVDHEHTGQIMKGMPGEDGGIAYVIIGSLWKMLKGRGVMLSPEDLPGEMLLAKRRPWIKQKPLDLKDYRW